MMRMEELEEVIKRVDPAKHRVLITGDIAHADGAHDIQTALGIFNRAVTDSLRQFESVQVIWKDQYHVVVHGEQEGQTAIVEVELARPPFTMEAVRPDLVYVKSPKAHALMGLNLGAQTLETFPGLFSLPQEESLAAIAYGWKMLDLILA